MSQSKALIWFGDGLQALYYDERTQTKNRFGEKIQEILLVPSEELKEAHELKEDDLNILTKDGRKGIWMEFPVKEIKWLRKGIGAVVLIFSNFKGNETELMEYYDGLFEWHKSRDKTEDRLIEQVETLQEELDDSENQMLNLLRRNSEALQTIKGNYKVEEEQK